MKKIVSLALVLVASIVLIPINLDARGGGGRGGGGHGGFGGGGRSFGGGGRSFGGGSSRMSAGRGGYSRGYGSRVVSRHGGYGYAGRGGRGWDGHRGWYGGLWGRGLWGWGVAWPYTGLWWNSYWGPDYWDDYPYLVETTIDIDDDYWNVTNDSDNTIVVGTYDGAIRGRIRPDETVQIPRRGSDRLIIGHEDDTAHVFRARAGNISVTNNMLHKKSVKAISRAN